MDAVENERIAEKAISVLCPMVLLLLRCSWKSWRQSDNHHADKRLSYGDHTMIDQTAFLKSIADNEIENVGEVLAHYRSYDDSIEAFKEMRNVDLEQLEAEVVAKREQEVS
ncbi:hypothetical protein WA026_023256 [Henosepilachna vigintioctopunctata]|uniref:Uncharacterized protein n=1 Tax=Henosepilachna vigintioctopunctata TaxID=420089 RepID=A0AAW1V6M7_9CUCU